LNSDLAARKRFQDEKLDENSECDCLLFSSYSFVFSCSDIKDVYFEFMKMASPKTKVLAKKILPCLISHMILMPTS
jgi:hypothetical protein